MKKITLLLLLSASLLACKDQKKEKESAPQEPVESATVVPFAEDSAAIRKVIMDFYKWYTVNYEKLLDFKLYDGVKKPDMPPYQIKWDAVDKYHAYIRESVPQLGEAFLVRQKKFFQECDSAFKVDLEGELPYGFDYDWYTNSQEDPSYLLEGLQASNNWVIQVKNEEANVEIGAPENKNYASGSLLLFVGLKKENGQWKMAQIGND